MNTQELNEYKARAEALSSDFLPLRNFNALPSNSSPEEMAEALSKDMSYRFSLFTENNCKI